MKPETATRLAFIPLALGFACFGCALLDPPDASVIVLDESGAPIEGAGSGMQYWTNFKPSNAKGRLYLRDHQTYVYKPGYRTFQIEVERGVWKKEIVMTKLAEGEPDTGRYPYRYVSPLPPPDGESGAATSAAD